jgi:hypothetical protein
VIYDTLIKQASEEEIVAIIGHELGHWYLSHNLKNMFIGFVIDSLSNSFSLVSVICHVLPSINSHKQRGILHKLWIRQKVSKLL